MNLIEAGTYPAKVEAHAISETSKGDPQAAITFSFQAEGKDRKITWYGSFKEKAQPYTLKALLVCGLKGNNPAGDLEIGREVSIVISVETNEKNQEINRVQWVNAPSTIRNVIPGDMAKSKLSALEGAVLAARQNLKINDPDEIPF